LPFNSMNLAPSFATCSYYVDGGKKIAESIKFVKCFRRKKWRFRLKIHWANYANIDLRGQCHDFVKYLRWKNSVFSSKYVEPIMQISISGVFILKSKKKPLISLTAQNLSRAEIRPYDTEQLTYIGIVRHRLGCTTQIGSYDPIRGCSNRVKRPNFVSYDRKAFST
jgi:hypothetical protein